MRFFRAAGVTVAAAICVVAAAGLSSVACGTKSTSTCGQSGAALQTEAPVCPPATVVKGVDVSTYDGVVDWPTAKAAGILFAFARVSDGLTHPDDKFAPNWPAMKAAGVVRGAYQYFRASEDPVAQANMVLTALTNAGGLAAGDLPVVADVETADGQTAKVVETKLAAWLAVIEKGTGRPAIIYTSIGTWPVTSTTFANRPLWVANYGVSCPSLPAGWTAWKFWQSSDVGTVKGITGKVDLDEFSGTLAELLGFAGDAGAPPPAPDAGPIPPPPIDDASAPPVDASPPPRADAGATMGSGPCL
jgi:lysozyme